MRSDADLPSRQRRHQLPEHRQIVIMTDAAVCPKDEIHAFVQDLSISN
jgi:hypothetical protein